MSSRKKTQFQQGKSGNPTGKNKSNFGELIRSHPKSPALIQKLFDIALTDGEKHQIRAISILMDRIAPQLKASEIKAEISENKGVIILPQKGRGGATKNDKAKA
jgi:hypothetical protein